MISKKASLGVGKEFSKRDSPKAIILVPTVVDTYDIEL